MEAKPMQDLSLRKSTAIPKRPKKNSEKEESEDVF